MDIDAIVLAVMRAQEADKEYAKKDKKDHGDSKEQGKHTIRGYACGTGVHNARECPNVIPDGEVRKE